MSDVIRLAHSNDSDRIEEFGDKLAELIEEFEDIGDATMMQILDLTTLAMKMAYLEFDEI